MSKKIANTIRVEGIQVYAYHGCLPEEERIGGNYIVNVYIETDFHESALKDDLEKTVDYCDVYKIVKEEMAIRAKLIETVAYRILNRICSELNNIHSCRVCVVKLCPPMNGNVDRVSVEVESDVQDLD